MTLRSAWFHHSAWRTGARAVLATAFTAASTGGCSLFYDLNTTQCEVTSDCTAFGPQFANTECINRVCVAKVAGSGGMSNDSMGGKGGKAGTSGGSGGLNSSGGDMSDAGSEAGGTGGIVATSGGTAGTVGAGGSGPPPECVTNGDCIDAHVDQPYICRDTKCVQVTTDDCPVLLPTNKTLDLLRKASPILLGGFASMTNAQDPHDTQAVINWDLAFNEFNTNTLGGLPATGNSGLRPVMALVCQGKTTDVSSSMAHLTADIRTPGILSTLSADNLLAAYNYTVTPEYAASGADPVFFMSTGSADSRLASLNDDGMVWHMLGGPRILTATIASLVKRIEPVINRSRKAACPASPATCIDDPDTVPLRVTLVSSDDVTMTDLTAVLTSYDSEHPETLLTFNGAGAIYPANAANFRTVTIQSSRLHTTPDVTAALTDLQNNPPHLIIALATNEFPKTVMPSVENGWAKSGSASVGMERPYYLVSHLLWPAPELQTVVANFAGLSSPLNMRTLGVNYAEAQDDRSKGLYASYLSHLQQSYQGTLAIDGTENHYDGAYSLLYALAAASGSRITPKAGDIREGLTGRVFNTSNGTPIVDIGPKDLASTVSKLSNDSTYKMELWATMGPPNFDRLSGTRISATSAWCIQKVGSTWTFQADGLLYDPDAKTFAPPATGSPACLQGYN